MALQDNEILLNNVLIDMAHSFLQYVAESCPWVRLEAQSVEEQVKVLAARQRQDVAELASLLTAREHHIDFGSFPTEYTDLQFLSLLGIMKLLVQSQEIVTQRIADAGISLSTAGDVEGAELMKQVEIRQRESVTALKELHQELARMTATT